jgi:hypothetical protein
MNTLATDFLIVVGMPGELAIDLDRLRVRMETPAIQQDLRTVGFTDPCRLVYTELVDDDELAAYLGEGPVNTDDRPVLSYSTYGASFRSTIAANLMGLLRCRSNVGKWVHHAGPINPMLRHYAASNEALMGHVAAQVGDEADALNHYLRGAQLLPEDKSFRELVVTTYFRTHPSIPSE